MNVKEAIYKRRSVRKYKQQEVSNEKITKLLECAMAAPSAINKQPWEFYVIKNKIVQEIIKTSAPYYNYNSPLLIVVGANLDRSIIKSDNDFWIQDCSAAIENILLEAVELELGTCWCGVYPVNERVDLIKEVLQLPENIVPLGLLHVGYPEGEYDGRTQYDINKIHYVNE